MKNGIRLNLYAETPTQRCCMIKQQETNNRKAKKRSHEFI